MKVHSSAEILLAMKYNSSPKETFATKLLSVTKEYYGVQHIISSRVLATNKLSLHKPFGGEVYLCSYFLQIKIYIYYFVT